MIDANKIEKAMADAGAVLRAVQRLSEELLIAMGKPPDDDTVGNAPTPSDELLLALQKNGSWENFLLVHGELMRLLMAEASSGNVPRALRDEFSSFVTDFYSLRDPIISFITGDDAPALSLETGIVH